MKKPTHVAADAALAVAIVTALLALPPALVPWPWLAGYALPGVLLHVGQRLLPHRRVATMAVAALTLLGASVGLRAFVPSGSAAPIACILSAPLAYFALCRTPVDRRYTLFLALCMLVIGSVLDSGRARACGVAFAICSALVLAFDSAATTRAAGRGPRAGNAPRTRRARQAAAVTAISVLTAASLFQLLTIAPVPDRGLAPPAPNPTDRGDRVQGLSTQFDLSAADGWLDTVRDLQASMLAAVRSEDGDTPSDLYLRFVHFDLAGANRWATAKFVAYPQAEPDGWTLFAPEPGTPARRYTIERAPLANGHLLLPAGTWRVQGVGRLEGHTDIGLLREQTPSEDTLTYRAFVLASDARDARIDLSAMYLRTLPEALMTGDVANLAQRYVRDAGPDPMERALALTRGLRRDYAYTRRDPTGPAPDVLHNFLFHAKAGYCMHFASALAVMLRLQRIPSRIGAGLYGGRADERPGWRAFGAADAHAWVEVPCVGRGWVVLDATPEATRAARARDAEMNAPEPAAAPAAAGADDAPGLVPPWLFAALFLAGLVLVPSLRRAAPIARDRVPTSLPTAHPARVLLARILRNLATAGVSRQRHETLARLAARAVAQLEVDGPALADAFTAYEEVRFGAASWDAARSARMQRVWRRGQKE